MLKVNVLQAMQQVKFDGNPIKWFSNFQKGVISIPWPWLLTDSHNRKGQFLPNFVSGHIYENVKTAISSRMYILRVCKFYGFSQHDLTVLFDSI